MLDRVQTVDPASSIGKALAGGKDLLPDALVVTREAKRYKCCSCEDWEKGEARYSSEISASSVFCNLQHIEVCRLRHHRHTHKLAIDIGLTGIESRRGGNQ